MITQLTGSGYSGRRYGSFSGRAEVVPLPAITESYSGGCFGYDLDRPLRLKSFKADDEEEKKAKPILEDIAEILDPINETSRDYELILRLRLREQGIIYKSLYLKWLKKQAEYKKSLINKQNKEKNRKKRRQEEEIILLALLN